MQAAILSRPHLPSNGQKVSESDFLAASLSFAHLLPLQKYKDRVILEPLNS